MPDFDAYFDQRRRRFEEELCDFLRIPSVSAASEHRDDVRRAAEWVANQFRALGLKTEFINTALHPLVYAASPPIPGAPTVLVYGHYDVQPPDPLGEWVSPPFEPQIRNGNLYARGATDDKGQMLTHVKSAQAWLDLAGALPVQLKFLIEGEEEVGSESLYNYLATDSAAENLACDIVVISDTSQFAPGKPAITYGLRGIAYYELRLTGPKQDLHSGTFGGGVTNPANALARLLAALVDENGRVQVPRFYSDVTPLSQRERDEFAHLDQVSGDAEFLGKLGLKGATGETGYSIRERRWARPTCDINGITSGYQGEGAKTVLPARASAKFSFRLVPHQKPADITHSLEQFLRQRCPPGIEMELISFQGAPGIVTPLDSEFVKAASLAIERGFGVPPVFIREGGSIPIVTAFREKLGVDTLLLGWGLDDDNTHGPNEKFCLADFHRGMKASAQLWSEIAKIRVAPL